MPEGLLSPIHPFDYSIGVLVVSSYRNELGRDCLAEIGKVSILIFYALVNDGT